MFPQDSQFVDPSTAAAATTETGAAAQEIVARESTHPVGTATLSEVLISAQQGDFQGLVALAINLAVPATLALLFLFIGYLAAKFLGRMIAGSICKRVDETLGRFAGRFVFYSVLTCTLIGVASTVGVNVTSFAALLAAAGFAIGMAFQGTLANFAAGILLLVFRPFKVGDIINAAGVIGKVNEIDLFTITLDTPDNRRLIVPNSAIAGNTIENVTFHAHRRVDVVVGVAYASDIEQTRQTLTAAAESLRGFLVEGQDRGYAVILTDLGASSVNWVVRFWAATPKFFEVREKLTAAVKQHLDEAGITIPFPQMDIHFDNFPGLEHASADEQTTVTRVRPRLRSRAS
jgi:small conductance mechanosensitive channel